MGKRLVAVVGVVGVVSLAGAMSACSKKAARDQGGDEKTAPPVAKNDPPKPPDPPAGDPNGETDCAKKTDLEKALTSAWKLDAGQKVELVGCTDGNFPQAATFALAYLDTERGEETESVLRHTIIESGTGAVIAEADEQTIAPVMRELDMSFTGLKLVDFDGDGAAEAIYEQIVNHGGGMSSNLRVFRRDGATLLMVLDLVTDYDTPGPDGELDSGETCVVDIEVGKPNSTGARELVLSGLGENESASEGCIKGNQIYALEGGKFVPAE